MRSLVLDEYGCWYHPDFTEHVVHGITTNFWGNTSGEKESIDSLQFSHQQFKNFVIATQVGAGCFAKLIPEHGDKVSVVRTPNLSSPPREPEICIYRICDSLVHFRDALDKNPVLIGNTADCPYVILVDHFGTYIALIHCGWRSTRLDIIPKTLERIRYEIEFLGGMFNPAEIKALVIGGIGGCCYEFRGEEAGNFTGYISENGKLNLPSVLRDQLVNCGVCPADITVGDSCSFCSSDDQGKPIFASYRRDASDNMQSRRNSIYVALKR